MLYDAACVCHSTPGASQRAVAPESQRESINPTLELMLQAEGTGDSMGGAVHGCDDIDDFATPVCMAGNAAAATEGSGASGVAPLSARVLQNNLHLADILRSHKHRRHVQKKDTCLAGSVPIDDDDEDDEDDDTDLPTGVLVWVCVDFGAANLAFFSFFLFFLSFLFSCPPPFFFGCGHEGGGGESVPMFPLLFEHC